MITTCYRAPLFPRETQRFMFQNLVDVATGEVHLSETDYASRQVSGLILRRTYRTQSPEKGVSDGRWHWGLDTWLERQENGWQWHRGNGNVVPFTAERGQQVRNVHFPHLVFEQTESQEVSLTMAKTVRFGFQVTKAEIARLISIQLVNGPRLFCEYEHDVLAALQSDTGYRLTLTWQGNNLSSVQEVHGSGDTTPVVSYAYNDDGRLITVGSSTLGTTHYTYGKNGLLEGLGIGTEKPIKFVYESQGRCAMIDQGAFNRTINFKYHDADFQTEVNDGAKSSHIFHINAQGKVEQQQRKDGTILQFQWDQYQRITRVSDSDGNAISIEYDQKGFCRKVLVPKAGNAEFTWTEEGSLSCQDLFGIMSEYQDNETGQIQTAIKNGHMVWRQEWTKLGEERLLLDRQQRSFQDHFNKNQRLVRRRHLSAVPIPDHPRNAPQETSTYTPRHELTAWHNINDETWQWEYDAAGRPAEIFLGSSITMLCRYDFHQRLCQVGDPDGRSISWSCTSANQLEELLDAEGNTYQIGWGSHRRINKITNPAQQVAFFQYDGSGNLVEFVDYQGRVIQYQYDIWGNFFAILLPDKQLLNCKSDPWGKLQEVTSSDGTTSYRYDDFGWPVAGESSSCKSALSWTNDGDLTWDEQQGRVVAYQLDDLGFPLERETQTGTKCLYTWTHNYQVCHVTLPGKQVVTVLLDERNREIQRWTPEGFVLRQSFDINGNLQIQNAGKWEEKTLYDEIGPKKSITPRVKREFLFDSLGFLRAIRTPFSSSWFTLDANGRTVTAMHDGSIREELRYNASGRILEITRQFQGQEEFGEFILEAMGQAGGYHNQLHTPNISYTWDQRGRATSRKKVISKFQILEWHFRWNNLDQLVSVKTPKGAIFTYVYDAFGRRIEKRIGDRGKYFVWEGPRLAEEISYETRNQKLETGATTTWFYLPRQPVPFAGEIEGQVYLIVPDHQLAPREMLTNEGEVVWSARYTATGGIIAPENQGSQTLQCPFRQWGSYFDPESGLIYDGTRYYDPETGRYLSSHPERERGLIENGLLKSNPLETFLETLCKVPHAGDRNIWTELLAKHTPISASDFPQLNHIDLKCNGVSLWFEHQFGALVPNWPRLLEQALQRVDRSTVSLARIDSQKFGPELPL